MLPPRSRIRTPAEHALVTRRGRRVARGPVVVHALVGRAAQPNAVGEPQVRRQPPRAGFVVSRKVGNAVTRNRVRRRLREQVRARLDRVPDGGMLLVRAQPSAAKASSEQLGRALDDVLRTVTATAVTATAESPEVRP